MVTRQILFHLSSMHNCYHDRTGEEPIRGFTQESPIERRRERGGKLLRVMRRRSFAVHKLLKSLCVRGISTERKWVQD